MNKRGGLSVKPHHFVAVCRQLFDNPGATQRELASGGRLSLGVVNATVKECLSAGFLKHDGSRMLVFTDKGRARLEEFRVKNAVILAAGFGSRCMPRSLEPPKGLLRVFGQPMIERQIEQLHEKGITDIIIVVGYRKESFDYLIDKYGVRLVYNPEYSTKNNLASLYHVSRFLGSTYMLMSDSWVSENIFNAFEARSWYSCVSFDGPTSEWCVKATPSGKIESIFIGGTDALAVVGPAFFSHSFSEVFRELLDDYYRRPGTEDYFWEHILKERIDSLPIYVNDQTGNVFEFGNFDELRRFDPSYLEASNSQITAYIAKHLNVPHSRIEGIVPIKEGMTNRSYSFTCDDTRYIMRIPGEGTDKLINRREEHSVYEAIGSLNICDDVIVFCPESGHKITVFWEDAKGCDPFCAPDVAACMKKLREFHELRLSVAHSFDIFERIEYYESLWVDRCSCFVDYSVAKANVMRLRGYVDSVEKVWTLSHIDSVPDNFLFVMVDGVEQLRIIDWEYGAMQDAHLDIAMFAVYAMYDREQIDVLIDCYFDMLCPNGVRTKIYAYVALCGLLWSNWCEYKRQLGVEFGEYALRQYRYAKDFYRIFSEEQEKQRIEMI